MKLRDCDVWFGFLMVGDVLKQDTRTYKFVSPERYFVHSWKRELRNCLVLFYEASQAQANNIGKMVAKVIGIHIDNDCSYWGKLKKELSKLEKGISCWGKLRNCL
jgi:hypothetical protein